MTKTKTPQMERTWLVQRLNAPRQMMMIGGKAVDNPFSFGGGLRNGGLSDDAMDLLRPLFSFDYMGAAEFEFGAVPKAIQRIAKFADAGDLEAFSFEIDLKDVHPHYREPKGYKPKGTATIYMLAPHDWLPEVEARIRGWAKSGYASSLKETTRLDAVLRPDPDEERASWNEVRGWLELDNGFMFFTDETMFRGVAAVFGVEVD